MKIRSLVSTPLLVVLATVARASPATAPPTNETDLIANWTFDAYSDGLCESNIVSDGGNTPRGCTNIPNGVANSYRFRSSKDPRTGVRFIASIFASQNCQNKILDDDGTTITCHTVQFESWSVRSQID